MDGSNVNANNVGDAESTPIQPRKLTASERKEKADNIKKGFGSGEYKTQSPADGHYSGDYWEKGLLLIYDRQGSKIDDYVYCKICDEVFYGNPSNGSAPFTRHITKKHAAAQATVVVPTEELAQILHDVMEIAIRYNVAISAHTMTGLLPQIR